VLARFARAGIAVQSRGRCKDKFFVPKFEWVRNPSDKPSGSGYRSKRTGAKVGQARGRVVRTDVSVIERNP